MGTTLDIGRRLVINGNPCRIEAARFPGHLACTGCHFYSDGEGCQSRGYAPCKWWTRADKNNVIFTKLDK